MRSVLVVSIILLSACNGADEEVAPPAGAEANESVSNPVVGAQTDSLPMSAEVYELDSLGFGFRILQGETPMIDQPHIPAVSGMNGFASAADAQKVAELMMYKINNGIMPPSITIEELDSLQIDYERSDLKQN